MQRWPRASSARNAGAERVLVLEKAPEEMRGGNTHYSGGLLRIAFDSVDQILRLVPKAQELEGFVDGVEAYPRDAFWADLRRMTSNRTDPELGEILISNSFDTAVLDGRTGDPFRTRDLARRGPRRQPNQMAQGRDRARGA